MREPAALSILVCSDGTRRSASAVRFATLLCAPGSASVTLLGILERGAHADRLARTLREQAALLAAAGVPVRLVRAVGEPVDEIARRTEGQEHDLVVIGGAHEDGDRPHSLSARAYRIVKAIRPAVLVVAGAGERLDRILLSVGSRKQARAAVELTGRVARAAAASVTLFHVVAEPPAMYAELLRRQADTESILESDPGLAEALSKHVERLAEIGVPARIRVRHGLVLDELLEERRRGEYDLLVVGSVPTAGVLQSYLLGGVTREVLSRADCPVLVVRTAEPKSALRGLATRMAARLRGLTAG